MKYDIESKLNTVKTQIDMIAMTEAEKNTMWRKIEMSMNKKTAFAFIAIRTHIRAAAAFTLVVLFAGSSVAFAYADTAKPGDVLFPLGVAREKVEIFLAPESKKNDLRVKFAEKRIEDGQAFLSLLVKAKGTYASATAFASSTATTTAATTATTTPNSATEAAVRHFNATIAYLQGIQAELLNGGDIISAGALQNAIDAMIAEAHQVPANDSSVLVKIKDNANKFKMDVRIANDTTTTRLAIQAKNNERGHGGEKDDDDVRPKVIPGATTTTQVISFSSGNFISRFFHKENTGRGHDGDDRKERDDEDRNDDDDNEGEDEGFFDRFRGKTTICHISGDTRQTISIGKSAVQAHLAHGDSLGVCTVTPAPDTTAPGISSIVSQPTSTSANIAWDTNESASYKFWFGTTSPIILSGTPDRTGGANTHQTVSLTGLSADTTYHYVIVAVDASENTATSTEQSFKTAVIPDTIAPTISDLSAALITSSSATVYWNTNESATGKVKYGTTTPLTNVLENTAFSPTHSFSLTGLTASTTYRYIVSSADGAGNAASFAELTFTTL